MCVFVHKAFRAFTCKSGWWPSLAECLFEDVSEYRGLLLLEGLSLCSPHLRLPYRPPRVPTPQCVLARHLAPTHWDSLPAEQQDVGGFSHHRSESKPRGRMGGGQMGV